MDGDGNPTVDFEGARHVILHPPSVERCKRNYSGSGSGISFSLFLLLPPWRVHKASDRFAAVMELALRKPIVKDRCGFDYLEFLGRLGHQEFVFGGAVRDVVRALAHDAGALNEVIAARINDVDIIGTASPITGRLMFDELHQGEVEVEDGVRVAGHNERGSIHVKPLSDPGAEGFDFNTLMGGGIYADNEFCPVLHRVTKPSWFLADLAQDCLNHVRATPPNV